MLIHVHSILNHFTLNVVFSHLVLIEHNFIIIDIIT